MLCSLKLLTKKRINIFLLFTSAARPTRNGLSREEDKIKPHTKLQHTRGDTTGGRTWEQLSNEKFHELEFSLFISKRQKKQSKPCSQSTEKPSDYRIELPSHNDTFHQ